MTEEQNQKNRAGEEKTKKVYQKPVIQTEKISIAALGRACNGGAVGRGHGSRKASAPCVTLLS